MSRYIEAEKILPYISRLLGAMPLAVLKMAETDGVDIVRCKECKWYRIGEYSGIYVCHKGLWDVTGNGFCSYGEREGE